MFDVTLIRRDRPAVEAMLAKRGESAPLDEILALDSQRTQLAGQITALGESRNRASAQIAKTPAAERPALIAQTRQIRDDLKAAEESIGKVEAKLHELLLTVPNMLAPDVPVGPDESGNVEVRKWGTPRDFAAEGFKPRDHVELGALCDLIDIEGAAKIAGTRTYYLKNEAVLLEFALVRYAMDVLMAHGFSPIIPPVLVKEKTLWATRHFPFLKDQIYKIEGDDSYLVGTSEIPLAGLHFEEILEEKQLPRFYAGFSSCYRTEVGSGGRDIRGLMRVHQFDKVEMFAYTRPEDSEATHERMVGFEETIFQGLEVPYQVIKMCSGDLGALAYKKYDIEAWKPADGVYREVTSCSNYVDFQARGTETRYRPEAGGKPQYVHTLNGTAVAVGRALVVLMENHQQKDGSIVIPQALRQYMPGGQDVIRPRK
jgi:seryl-tRNA synthetase